MTFSEILNLVTWRDALDILLVALVFYNLLLLIRGTRAVQMLFGMILLVAVYYLAGITKLDTLTTILEKFLILLPFVIVVLFQQEIRRALARFGRNPLWRLTGPQKVETVFQDVVLAATHLASRKIGALIIIERTEGLRSFAENGIALDANVSYDLLVNIFNPDSPLHDGAVIIQGEKIVAAACFLPLTLSAELSTEFGTRHRAALGITKETDALAVVVSEETGTISVAYDGELERDLDAKNLRNTLYQHLVTELYPQNRRLM
jgi:diadenylate cyclase